MRRLSLLFTLSFSSLAFSQVVDSVVPTSAARSGRIVINGSGFTSTEGQVRLDGGVAHIALWTDTKIVAYVPESASLGSNSIRVETAGGQSNPVSLGVTARVPGVWPVRWTFVASAPRVQVRPESGPDGTVYFCDLYAHLYALTPSGALKWIAKNAGADGAISFDRLGNIYTGGEQVIKSFDRLGRHRWTFVHGAQLNAGPNVGPDGNIYAAARDGYGAMVLSPSGQLLWNDTRVINPPVSSPQGNRVSFAGGNWSFVIEPTFFGSTGTTWSFRQGGGLAWSKPQGLASTGGAPDGSTVVTCSIDNNHLNSYWPDGSVKWSVSFGVVGKATNTPNVAVDGNVYLINQRSVVHALSPGGVHRWGRQISFNFDHPTTMGVRPDGKRIIAGSSPSLGQRSVVVNLDKNGTQIWRYELPFIGEWPIIMTSEFGFTRDQGTAIVGTSNNEYAADVTCHVIAFDASVPRGLPAIADRHP